MAVSKLIHPKPLLKADSASIKRYLCFECNQLLRDAVQLGCGHRLCQSCADDLIATESTPKCVECKEDIVEEEGAKYFPDRFVRREILNLAVVCPFKEDGCNWEGKYEQYQDHFNICDFASTNCEYCGEKLRRDQSKEHNESCPLAPRDCPLATLGCTQSATTKVKLQQHLEEAQSQHMCVLATKVQSLEKRLDIAESQEKPVKEGDQVKLDVEQGETIPKRRDFIDEDNGLASSKYHDSGVFHSLPPTNNMKTKTTAMSTASIMPSSNGTDIEAMVVSLLNERMSNMLGEMERNFTMELRAKNKEIAELKSTVTKMEKIMKAKDIEHEDRDFRLSLIENSNHDGTMLWKIPQFSQRKADAVNGKYTSIFSLPFHSGRYGYKMCLRLYIMGDGIGKGTHLSLFFVVMRGEFDNILQWPFTHKVTFKLLNQAGGRDIVDTFQPDPMSTSFKKPTSDMNVASGCPRFITQTELERGGFIVDDTIFIKCTINTATIRHP